MEYTLGTKYKSPKTHELNSGSYYEFN